MGDWLRIAELFDFEKGALQSSKCTPGEFTFITAAEEWKTHNEFTHDCEALIFAMGASGSLGRTHYFKGKFISSDLCFILQPKKHLKLDLTFYYYIFNFLRAEIVSKLAKDTSKLAINQKSFGDYKLPYFDYDHQLIFSEKLKNIGGITSEIGNEFDGQLSHLKLLRQAVLQEAVEGKLSAEWRKQHPVVKGDPQFDAVALLKQIKDEKERLAKEGKIRKEKLLPPIVNADKPFDLPEGWLWCRLGEVSEQYVDCPHATPHYTSDGYICLRAPNIVEGKLRFNEIRYVSAAEYEKRIQRLKPSRDDLVYIREGGRLGIAGIIDSDEPVCLGQRLMLVRFFESTTAVLMANTLNSPQAFKGIVGKTIGAASPHVNVRDVIAYPVPLPSLAEQQAIVDRVDSLMSVIDELEKQVADRKEQAQMLMQTVLREAFDSDSTAQKSFLND